MGLSIYEPFTLIYSGAPPINRKPPNTHYSKLLFRVLSSYFPSLIAASWLGLANFMIDSARTWGENGFNIQCIPVYFHFCLLHLVLSSGFVSCSDLYVQLARAMGNKPYCTRQDSGLLQLPLVRAFVKQLPSGNQTWQWLLPCWPNRLLSSRPGRSVEWPQQLLMARAACLAKTDDPQTVMDYGPITVLSVVSASNLCP